LATLSWPSALRVCCDSLVRARGVNDRPEPTEDDQPEDEEQWRRLSPPAVDGRCDRCGWRGKVYPGRYGGHRCAICFGLQWGWMPRDQT
jgi:hypothetical protein